MMIRRLSQRLRLHFFAVLALSILAQPASAQDGGFSQEQARLVAASSTGTAQQGTSVATSPDGNTVVVGGVGDNTNVGAAWIFTRSNNGTWTFLQKLVGNDSVGTSRQGSSVALSADGNTIIVGAKDDTSYGVVRIFTRSGNVWTQQGPKLVGVDGWHPSNYFWQGNSVALSADGNTALVGGPGQAGSLGAAFVFVRSGGAWTQQSVGALRGSDAVGGTQQGFAVALSADGNTAIVGAPTDNNNTGTAFVYTRSGGSWSQQGAKLSGSDAVPGSKQGGAVALSSDGNTALIGAPNDNNSVGAVWVFTRTAGVWSQQGLKLSNSGFSGERLGYSVSLSADGNTALTGIPYYFNNIGAAAIFRRTAGVWGLQGQIRGYSSVGTAVQGFSVALAQNGSTAILGGPGESGSVGAAFILIAPPTITNVTPASGPVAGGTNVSITGTFLTGTTSVNFGGVPATNVNIVNAGTITATTPAHAFGTVNVDVNSPHGTGTDYDVFTYTRTATTTSLGSATNPSVFGQSVTFTATVTGATPTGTVTFKDGATALCSAVALTTGQAQCISGALAVGSHSMTAVYSGDSTNANSTSSIVNQVVNKANTTTVIGTHTPNPSTVGLPIAVAATVSVTAPGAGTTGGTITVSDGTANCVITLPATSCNLTPTSTGAKTLTAIYSGNGSFNGSTSPGVSHTVNINSTSTVLGASANPSAFGQSVTFTATVTGLTPTGTVTFNDGATALCSAVALTTGQAQCISGALTVGSHNMTAVYSGDSRNATSTSSILTQVVTDIFASGFEP